MSYPPTPWQRWRRRIYGLRLMYGLYRSWDNSPAVATIKAMAGELLQRSMWTNPARLWPFPPKRNKQNE